MSETIEELLKFGTKVAKKAGKILLKHYGRIHKVEMKGINNLVTEADRKSEHFIVKKIQKKYPGHAIFSEECGYKEAEKLSDDEIRWIIDPLDGTTNFAHSFPIFAVSIGIEKNGELIGGIVYVPMLDELFYAGKYYGAYLNKKKISVSNAENLRTALLATGFPPEHREINLPFFEKFLFKSQAMRRTGSAATDLCYVACGRLDGFWEFGLHEWDVAAGAMIVMEAGGRVTNIDGSRFNMRAGQILATNGKIHEEMLG